MFRYAILLIMSFCFFSIADAETIILQSGQKITGQIIEHTDLRVTVEVQGVPQTYFLGEVVSIDGKKPDTLKDNNAGEGGAKVNPPKSFNNRYRANPRQGPNLSFRARSSMPQDIIRLEEQLAEMHDMIAKISTANKNVVPTSDGASLLSALKELSNTTRI